ncbi:MAG: hypothetical protein DI538_08865 [Azospira oryzae]|jgi:hypothetical protein|nr:MAG: hypothetical protein DI538_08865 [Azospira oryzae]
MVDKMKVLKINVKRRYLIAVGSILAVFLLLIIVLSSLTKYVLEKHDVEWFGREATVGWAYVNPITGYVHLHDVAIYEKQGDSVFLSARGASARFTLPKLVSREVEIARLTIDHPWGKVVQKKDTLNFDDVIEKFTPDESDTTPSRWHVTLLDTDIIEGEFHYYEKIIPINYFIKNVNITGPGKTRDVDTLSAKFSFNDGKGKGSMKGDFTINMKNLDYRFGAKVNAFDLEIIRQYIWELINYGMFHARLDADIKATGNFSSQDSIRVNGRLLLSDFHLGKTNEDAYLAFKKLAVVVDELSPARHTYRFDSIALYSPYFKYEIFDSLDNVQALFGKEGKNISDITEQTGRFNLVIEIARYIRALSRNFFESDFQIRSLGVFNGNVTFNDYSISEKFSIHANPLTIRADSIYKRNKRVGVTLTSAIKPYGKANLFIHINPRDSGDFDMKYNIENVPVAAFNPYLVSLTSFQLDRGTLALNGLWNVRDGKIQSNNHVLIVDPRVTNRVRNDDVNWIPMPLVMSLVRDRGNVIDYEVPITGNLKHPRFHLSDVITDAMRNIFVKPATTPYRIKVRRVEEEIEKAVTVKWEMNQRQLSSHQLKLVKDIARFLKEHPAASLVVNPVEYETKEKEHLLFYEAKKKYFLIARNKHERDFTEQDSLEITKMSVKDHALVRYISRNLSDTVMFTLQEKCMHFVGSEVVNRSFNQLVHERKKSFRSSFVENGTERQMKIKAGKSSIPYNGFSYFRLDYPEGMDDRLRKAYEKIKELNNEAPRKDYRKERSDLSGKSG